MNKRIFRTLHTVKDIISAYQPINSEVTRVATVIGNAILGLAHPTHGEYLSTFGECSSYRALQEIQAKMQSDPTGALILKEKPRIRTPFIDFKKLSELKPSTFGWKYAEYITTNGFDANERPIVKHIGDIELAYIYQRYKEIHDFLHTILMKDRSIFQEVEVKWFEFQQLGLVSAALSALAGPALLDFSSRLKIISTSGPEMIEIGKSARFCMNIYYEKHFEDDFTEFRSWFLNKPK